MPIVSYTSSGKPGDPINVGLVGEMEDVVRAFVDAGWEPADPVTLKSSVRILKDVVFKKPDPNAPVSNLYVRGRRQNIAFEQEVNGSPCQRHHVRLWMSDNLVDGRPLWVGASTYDRGVYYWKFSHHISPDVDAERVYLFGTMTQVNLIDRDTILFGRGPTDRGLNGENDVYITDGRIRIGWVQPISTSLFSKNTGGLSDRISDSLPDRSCHAKSE